MSQKRPSIAIVGAGMGGLVTAAALDRARIDVTVYEQAPRFARVGSGIIAFSRGSRMHTAKMHP